MKTLENINELTIIDLINEVKTAFEENEKTEYTNLCEELENRDSDNFEKWQKESDDVYDLETYFKESLEKECKERLKEYIESLSDSDFVTVWNEYCYTSSNYDDEILDSYSLEEQIENSNDTIGWLNKFYFGSDENREGTSANPNRDYFTFDGYANITSFDYPTQYIDELFFISDMIDYIVETDENLQDDNIEDIINEYR